MSCSNISQVTTSFGNGVGFGGNPEIPIGVQYPPFDVILEGQFANGDEYRLEQVQDAIGPDNTFHTTDDVRSEPGSNGNTRISFTNRSEPDWYTAGGDTDVGWTQGRCLQFYIKLRNTTTNQDVCRVGSYQLCEPESDDLICDNFYVYQNNSQSQPTNGCFSTGRTYWTLSNLRYTDGTLYNGGDGDVEIQFTGGGVAGNDQEPTVRDGAASGSFQLDGDDIGTNQYVRLTVNGREICTANPEPFVPAEACSDEQRGEPIANAPPVNGSGSNVGSFVLCEQIPNTTAREDCRHCDEDLHGVWTAVGCISRQPTSMIQTLMGIGLSLAGGVCLLMMLAAGFTFSTSQGDPKKTGQAKEMMTSAIVGLVFILLSVTLLQFIGVSLLGIPGFGS